ncbi:MAG: phosphoadenylyl-sulfate reductase [Nitratireductor sp.]|nr:phosphoadenylyl-sulfate reductase [Nitratireductor sp.]
MADAALQERTIAQAWLPRDAQALNTRFAQSGARRMLETMLAENEGKRIALVSSFGSNSVVLLHLVASVDPSLPVLFIDTGKLFGQTHRYREELAARLGLTHVRSIGAPRNHLYERDPAGALWLVDKSACCSLRKVEPFTEALKDFDIWISGRKRYQGGARANLPLFEADGPRLKVNPLTNWTSGDVDVYRSAFSLPQHPLVEKGYRSIGCEPCTTPVGEGEDERAGRWRGETKTECGIHFVPENPGLLDETASRTFG